MMTHLSLFSGIGGLDLAAEWAGMVTVGQCELADYPHAVLCKHWPDVPKWRDIRTLTKESFYGRTGLRTVDIISGGFPCQPFSVAGKQKGKDDDRYLWPELFRVIRELTPRWVVGENVPGILRIAAADIVADLEREGYDVVLLDFEAAAVGALHRRERIAFVANRDGERKQQSSRSEPKEWGRIGDSSKAMANAEGAGMEGQSGGVVSEQGKGSQERQSDIQSEPSCAVWNTTGKGLQNRPDKEMGRSTQNPKPQRPNWWAVEPDVGRVAHGIPKRVDRLKCIGNAVVPQQFYPIFKAIAEVEANAYVTASNVETANRFHRVDECGKLEEYNGGEKA